MWGIFDLYYMLGHLPEYFFGVDNNTVKSVGVTFDLNQGNSSRHEELLKFF